MSNPTSNFGWQMPTNTDLVSQLPADFEVFGQAVDTSLADLKGGTTGQVLKKNTNADMDFVWAADAAGMTNPMTTTGDTIYSSSGSTPARLAIGSTGNVLTVAGGVPTWSAPVASTSSISQIATGSLSGTSVTISGLSSYDKLFLRILNGGSTSGNSNQILRTRINNNSGSNYLRSGWIQQIADGSRYSGFTTETAIIAQENPMFGTGLGALYVELENCKATGFTTGRALRYYTASSQADGQATVSFIYTQAEAVSSLVLTLDGTATFNSGTYTVWGA